MLLEHSEDRLNVDAKILYKNGDTFIRNVRYLTLIASKKPQL